MLRGKNCFKVIPHSPIGRHPAPHGIGGRVPHSRSGGRTQHPCDRRNGLFFLRAQAAAVAFAVQPSVPMTGAAASAPPDASALIKASLPPAADTETFAFVAAVVLNVASSKGGRLKKVFSFVFGTLAGGDDAALEVCVISDFDLIAVFSGINTALLGYGGMVCFDFALAVTAACTESVTDGNLDVSVLLFALIGFSILNAFYMQVARICLYAFADKLRTFEGGIPAASDGGFAGRAADMCVAMGCFCLIAVATC